MGTVLFMLHNGTVSVADTWFKVKCQGLYMMNGKENGKKQLGHFKVINELFHESIDTKMKHLMW